MEWLGSRVAGVVLAVASTAAMLYVGLYQSRVVERMWCPLLGGCEAVADAPFARPFGVPDGYLGAGLFATIALLLAAAPGRPAVRAATVVLTTFAVYANVKGVYDMATLGAYCTYCMATALTAPWLLWVVWRLR